MCETKLGILVHFLFNSPYYQLVRLIPLPLSWANVFEAELSQDPYAYIQAKEEARD